MNAPSNTLLASTKAAGWYKDAIFYEVHVRAFLDSNGDGIGDFPGLTQKLDYLADLGVTAIWLLPFYPSPLKDDGYDIADYCSINPIYGTLHDFKVFLFEAHARNLRVITELVVNHTSDQHAWFQRSRCAAPGNAWRDFYVWSDSQEKYREARVIFRDFELSNWTWDPVAKAYFWHRFYSHQPDLNYDHPNVHKEIARVLDFWLDLGVDGMRLDAVPYLYEREGTSCENLPETHAYLKTLRQHVDEKYGDRMLLAEANQWPEEAVTYFGSGKGDECHMAFHFPLMPRIFMAVRMEDRVPIVDILEQTPAIPETSQWALFLRNHDELTLEMVTDEERDYMYRVYANDAKARINLGIRRRLAPLLGNDRRRIELLNLLLFSLPGTPVLYYGDEIGMGDNVFLGDRNGVRTPMQWSSDKNAGFSRASPQALFLPITLDPEYHYEAVNVETQQRNPNSLFWWMKQTLTLRKRYRAFGRGSLQFLQPENRKVLAFIRRYEHEIVLVVANLSRFSQAVQLDLAEFRGMTPVELFGHAAFPPIGEQLYPLTLSPYACFWFSLEPISTTKPSNQNRETPALLVPERFDQFVQGHGQPALTQVLAQFLSRRRWLNARDRTIKSVQIRDSISLPMEDSGGAFLVLSIEYEDGEPEDCMVPVAMVTGSEAAHLQRDWPDQVIARLLRADTESFLCVGVYGKGFCKVLLNGIVRRRAFHGVEGALKGIPLSALREKRRELNVLEPSFRTDEHNNLCVIFGDRYLLKLFRRLEVGANPDLELGRFLTERHFPNTPAVAGWLDYARANGEDVTAGILTGYVPNAQNGWDFSLDTMSRYFDRIRAVPAEQRMDPRADGSILELAAREPPQSVVSLIGTYLELARLLGQRTGELHLALASAPADSQFAPEAFNPFYQRSLFQSMRNVAVQTIYVLRRNLNRLPEPVKVEAAKVVARESEILKRLRSVWQTRLDAKRIRCHGDLHLGEVLYTGKDFIFIDFEGEPRRPLGERRLKRPPLRDIAGMIRSFDYVAYAALFKQLELGTLKEEQVPQWEPWINFWVRWVSATYLKAYLQVMAQTDLLPKHPEQLAILFEAHLLEKGMEEINYELTHRPHWLRIPLRGVLQFLDAGKNV